MAGRAWGAALALALPLALPATGSRAETAWVKDDLRLNLRTGPGTEYRIVGVMKTGDSVEILSRSDGWTQVRPRDLEEGWIPVGYLQPEPPASVKLDRWQTEVEALRARVEALTQEATSLRDRNEAMASQDEGQTAEIERLRRENLAFRAGARWPEWFTGAGILSAGMLLGILAHRSVGRRRPARVRL